MSVRRSRSGLAIFLCGVLVLASRAAWASGQGNTQTTSSNGASSNSQSGSSNTSGDSSKSSGDSSKSSSNSSGDSSKDSNNSTQNSPKNSSDYTSNSSSDWTTNSHGAHIFSIALAVVLVGATAIGIGVSTRSHQQQQARQALAAFMRHQHGLLTHDVTLAEGPLLAAWSHDLRLGAEDQRRLARALDGSREQGALLAALDGPIDEGQAERFAGAFMKLASRALGPARAQAMVRSTRLTCGD
ncbi:MAG TPA: hypothetical protein VN853_13095 [Polyangia bacterium]|nr:hypothetical protein [Polyangia bacterium]